MADNMQRPGQDKQQRPDQQKQKFPDEMDKTAREQKPEEKRW